MRNWRNSTFGERVLHVQRLRGVTLEELGALGGMKNSTIERFARQRATVVGASRAMSRLAEAWAVSYWWLIVGLGPITGRRAPPIVQFVSAQLRDHPEWPAARAAAIARFTSLPETIIDQVGETAFPMGVPGHLDEEFVGRIGAIYLLASLPAPVHG